MIRKPGVSPAMLRACFVFLGVEMIIALMILKACSG